MFNIKYFPLYLILLFTVFTELLFWFGPVKYNLPNNLLLVFFLLIVNVSFVLGYRFGINNFRPTVFRINYLWIKIFIVFGLVTEIVNLSVLWGNRGIDINNYFASVISGILNPGNAYYSESDSLVETSYFLMFFSIFQWISLPLGLIYWKKNSYLYKLITVITCLVAISAWLGIGVRKGIFDLFVQLLIVFIAINPEFLTNKAKRLKIFLFMFSLVLIFSFFFVISNLSRYGISTIENVDEFSNFNHTYNKFYLDYFGLNFTVAFSMLSGYLTQGYYALGHALNVGILEIEPMGISWFTIAISKKIGIDPTSSTYMAVLEQFGIDMSSNWHTFYVWIANGVTFFGVPIIVFFISYFLSVSWCDCLHKKNFLAYSVMLLFSMMSLYFYANNQIISFSFIPFVFIFTLYNILKFITYARYRH